LRFKHSLARDGNSFTSSSLGRRQLRELVARLASQIQQEPTCVLEGTIEGTLQPRLQLLDLGVLFCLARLPQLLLPSALLGALARACDIS